MLNNEQIVNEGISVLPCYLDSKKLSGLTKISCYSQDFLLKLNSITKKKQYTERSRASKGKASVSGQSGQPGQPGQKDQTRTKRNSSFAQSVYSSSLNASFNDADARSRPDTKNSREFDFDWEISIQHFCTNLTIIYKYHLFTF